LLCWQCWLCVHAGLFFFCHVQVSKFFHRIMVSLAFAIYLSALCIVSVLMVESFVGYFTLISLPTAWSWYPCAIFYSFVPCQVFNRSLFTSFFFLRQSTQWSIGSVCCMMVLSTHDLCSIEIEDKLMKPNNCLVQASREEKVHSPSNTWDTREAKHSPVDARQAKCEYALWQDERNLEMKEKLET
jgi:hypothetical protein